MQVQNSSFLSSRRDQVTTEATEVISHDIVLKDPTPTPIRQRPYRVPERMVESLRKEVTTMLEMGIIEPSKSE